MAFQLVDKFSPATADFGRLRPVNPVYQLGDSHRADCDFHFTESLPDVFEEFRDRLAFALCLK